MNMCIRTFLSYVLKNGQNGKLCYVFFTIKNLCMRQGAQGWCTGMTQKDGMAREVGGGFRMGNTCTPMADSCKCMAKALQYYKVISLQLK